MKVSKEWLSDYSKINVTTKELSDILTMTGSKVEAIETKGDNIKNVVIGKILEINKHPDADKLVVTKVDIKDEIVQIVTGANNIKIGDIVPIAKHGAELPNDVKIKKGMLRGIESCGMMCSIGELELTKEQYPDQVEDGIMILQKEMEEYLGEDAVEVLSLKEDIIEFEITPNRPDCLCVEGLGREVCASLKEEYKNPHKKIDGLDLEVVDSLEGLKVEIQDPDLCYRYVARVIKNVKIEESPDWLKKRLIACGVRPINNIVDITNYVMLEMGQPMHAFDINSINGKEIIVRRAGSDKTITTLDEVERVLEPDMLVIADKERPVALAGIMGGLNSEIEQDTNIVVFESASFHPGSIRRTSSKLGLRTESSSRYEKTLSPENALRAANRAVELVGLLHAGEVVEKIIDVYPTRQQEKKVKLDAEKINAILGTKIPKQDMIDILDRVEINIENDDMLKIPYYRQDIEGMADIAEEVIRFYGYNNLESTLINAESTLGIKNKYQRFEQDVRTLLINKGLSEICTYPFINEKDLKSVRIQKNLPEYKCAIQIKNPLSEDYTMMRTTTIPSVMKVLSFNYAKKNSDVSLFDFGKVYKDNGEIQNNELPYEVSVITIGIYGSEYDFYVLKGLVENVLEQVNIKRYDLRNEQENPMYHPGRCAKIFIGKDDIITFGEIHPTICENYGVREKVYIAEIYFEKLVRYSKENKSYTELPKYPAVERDIAITIAEDIEVGKVEELITKKAKKTLESLKLFDLYRSDKLGENKKSVAYSLRFRVNDRTLTDEEVNKTMEEILKELELELDAKLR